MKVWIFQLVFLLVVASFSEARAADIRLRAQTQVQSTTITLADVAEIKGDKAQAFGSIVVATLDESTTQTTVTVSTLRDALIKQKINLGSIALGGFARCKVTRQVTVTKPEPVALKAAEPAPLLANTIDEMDVEAQTTLRDQLLAALEKMSGAPSGELQVAFNDVDIRTLAQPAGTDRLAFELASPTRNGVLPSILGKQPIIIRRFQGNEEVGNIRVRPYITRRMLAVVTSSPVNRAEVFTRGNLQVQEVVLDQDRGQLVTQLSQALGQQARTSLGAGAVVYVQDLRPPLLIKKNDVVEVQCLAGGILLRMAGRAQEEGCLDDVIRVTNERALLQGKNSKRNREEAVFLARVTGLRQVTVDADGGTEIEGVSDVSNDAH